MPELNNAQVAEAYTAAVLDGDARAVAAFFADDVVLRIPPGSRLAGEYRGRERATQGLIDLGRIQQDHPSELVARLENITFALAEGQKVSVRMADSAGPERVILLFRERGAGAATDGPAARRAQAVRIEAGQITEIDFFTGHFAASEASSLTG